MSVGQQHQTNTMFQASPTKSPFKVNTDSNSAPLAFSPMKTNTFNLYSPFKETSLSPLKLFSQSPSKVSFDDWEKDLFSSLDENLFGIGGIADNVVDELLKSPQGKAFLESRNSPLRNSGNSTVVRQLRISPENNRHRGQHFQSLTDNSLFTVPNTVVKTESFEYTEMKKENTLEDHMYGQTSPRFGHSLSAIDPNKMSATPSKPGFTNVENAPKRKLTMRAVGSFLSDSQHMSNTEIQSGNVASIPMKTFRLPTWPSKERLKFARQNFKDILEKAVAKEIKLIAEEKRKKAEVNNICNEKVVVVKPKESKALKDSKGKGKRNKTYRKKKKDTHKLSVSKPAAKAKYQPPVIHKDLFSVTVPDFQDPGWYPSDDDEEEQMWTGPPPFYSQAGLAMYSDNEDSSENDELTTFKYETISGRRVTLKKPRLC